MSEFGEFDKPLKPVAEQSQQQSELADHLPASAALIDELRTNFPDLFGSAKVIYAKDLESGKEVKTRVYRLVERMSVLSVDDYVGLSQVAARINIFANRKKR
ncbi:hypothetical protein [Methylophilus sp. Leaf414]|uniref:hypothetical protein n=1 Tax=Methylophilus sp. Leaf414 TaxID=1736371 RepID=UPI0006FA01EB|nr:hypothetical protein [Methylophilus sp. Leaf414]KQT37695.1 hypothetical protein ASG24_01480 [Methylophilus sp. Leaf414]